MQLGKTSLQISTQGLGCMSMSEFYGNPILDSVGITIIKTAYDHGINFFDTADIYGFGRNETLVGSAISELINGGVKRESLVIASKCGIVRDAHAITKRGIDNSYAYIINACDKSLTRLGEAVKYIDLFYLHRIANQGDGIDESMQAMAALLETGKIKAVGLSEAKPAIIKAANDALLKYTNDQHQLSAVQSEYSLMTRNVEDNGVLDVCKELGITFVAYSPLSRALLTGEIAEQHTFQENDYRSALPRFQNENLTHNRMLAEKIKGIAAATHSSAAQVALAWLLHQPDVVPIPGTTKLAHLLANIRANELILNHAEFNALNSLGSARGERYTIEAMRAYEFDDESVKV